MSTTDTLRWEEIRRFVLRRVRTYNPALMATEVVIGRVVLETGPAGVQRWRAHHIDAAKRTSTPTGPLFDTPEEAMRYLEVITQLEK